MTPTFTFSDDYAVLTCKNARFYYGYEEIEQGEWCFTTEIKNHPKIKIPFSKLGSDAKHMFEVTECLIIGIGWVLTKYKIDMELKEII